MMLIDEEPAERVEWNEDGTLDEVCVNGGAHLEQMDDEAWFLSLGRADGTSFCVWWRGKITMTEERERGVVWHDPRLAARIAGLKEALEIVEREAVEWGTIGDGAGDLLAEQATGSMRSRISELEGKP